MKYLIPGILVAGQPAVLAGPRKSLKTTVGLDMVLSLATGSPFLGRFPTESPIRVGFMSGESGLGTLQETARRIAWAKGAGLSAVGGNLLVTESLPRFDNPAHLDALERWIGENDLRVVVIDPAYLCLPGEGAGNLFTMGQALGAVSRGFRRAGATMVLIHHARKNHNVPGKANPYGPLDLEDMAWAGFQEFARQWLLLSRREPFVPGTGEHRLWFSVGGSAGHSGLYGVDADEGPFPSDLPRTWQVAVRSHAQLKEDEAERREATQATRDRERLDSDMATIEAALARFPEGETEREVRRVARLPAGRFKAALQTLLDDGTAVACTVAKANRQRYPGVRWAETAAEPVESLAA